MNKKSLLFHLENNDYFGTLATILDLLRQDARKHGSMKAHDKTLSEIVEQLVFLQGNYLVAKKVKAMNRSVAGNSEIIATNNHD